MMTSSRRQSPEPRAALEDPPENLLGAHVSVAGGLEKAYPRADALGCTAMQIFVKNANRWQGPALSSAAVHGFRHARSESGVQTVMAHASYLINLASFEEPTYSRSLAALTDELDRCNRLGIDGLVLHPGAHKGHGPSAGIRRVAESLDRVLEGFDAGTTKLLLENTAGQGTYLGSSLEELAALTDQCRQGERIGFCLDTCHAFAAGWPLHQRAGLTSWLDEIASRLGLERVQCFHFNDSREACGSNRDRHANIGEGLIGSAAFARLMRAPQLHRIAKIIETPAGEGRARHRRDLERLRAQARRRVRQKPLVAG